MMIRKIVLVVVLTATSSTVIAQGSMQGTPKEQAACRPDVRKLCWHVKADEGSGAFLACLKKNREHLSRACRAVLESHSQ
jgi:hypothetical protein